MKQLVLLKIDGHIATITLNRPEYHNSLIPELLSRLLDILNHISSLNDMRVVILRANGRSFSTGGDVNGFYNHRDDIEAYADKVVGKLNEIIIAMVVMPIPIIAIVNGIVTGGSLGLVLASDMVLLTSKASFTPYYSVVGFSPDGGWTAILPELIGQKRVAEILMCNRTITANQAVNWGIANSIVQEDDIHDKAIDIAKEIAAAHIGSIACTKQLLHRNRKDFADRLDAERVHFLQQRTTKDAKRGMKLFLWRDEK